LKTNPQFAGASLPAQAEPALPLAAKKICVAKRDGIVKRDYYARLSARFLKDPLISPGAKLLRALLAAFADERTGRTFVSLRRLERLMRCGRKRRSAAQNELVAAGWLQLVRERAYGGRLGRLSFRLCEPPPPRDPPSPPSGPPARHPTTREPSRGVRPPCEPPVGRFATVVAQPSPNTSMPNKRVTKP
jgi:hypothetical protein